MFINIANRRMHNNLFRAQKSTVKLVYNEQVGATKSVR